MNGYEIFPVVHIFSGLAILDYYYYYINTTFINFSIGIYRKFIKDFFYAATFDDIELQFDPV